jgi:hypothetical protein
MGISPTNVVTEFEVGANKDLARGFDNTGDDLDDVHTLLDFVHHSWRL